MRRPARMVSLHNRCAVGPQDAPLSLPKTPGTPRNSIDELIPTTSPDLASLGRQLRATLDCELEQVDQKAEVRHSNDHPQAP